MGNKSSQVSGTVEPIRRQPQPQAQQQQPKPKPKQIQPVRRDLIVEDVIWMNSGDDEDKRLTTRVGSKPTAVVVQRQTSTTTPAIKSTTPPVKRTPITGILSSEHEYTFVVVVVVVNLCRLFNFFTSLMFNK